MFICIETDLFLRPRPKYAISSVENRRNSSSAVDTRNPYNGRVQLCAVYLFYLFYLVYLVSKQPPTARRISGAQCSP